MSFIIFFVFGFGAGYFAAIALGALALRRAKKAALENLEMLIEKADHVDPPSAQKEHDWRGRLLH